MKKISKIFIILLSIFIISSCTVEEEKILRIDVDIKENEVFVLDDFNLEELFIKAYINEDVYIKVNITPDMLSEDDLLKLTNYGSHEITVNYQGFTDTITLNLIAGSVIEDETFELSIFEINDTHGYIEQDETKLGGLSNTASIINATRNKNDLDDVVLIGNGDMFQGTAISNVTEGKAVIDAMNEMDFDMMGIGNHEFDWGIEKILRYFDNDQSNGEANFPLLNANIYERSTNSLLLLENSKMFESLIIEKEDIKVGLVSFIGNVASSISYNYIKPYEIKLDYEQRAKRICSNLKDQGADVIIVNIHGGESSGVRDYDFNNIVANLTYNGEYLVDAIINGHTHTRQKGFITRSGDVSCPVVQSSGNNKGLGKITLSIHKDTKDVIEADVYNLSVDTKDYDNNVQRVIDEYTNTISSEVYCVAGETVTSKSKMGIWVSSVIKEATRADVAIINTGSIRSTGGFEKGKNVTINNVYELYPFNNLICLTKVKASEIYSLLNKYEFYYSSSVDISRYKNSNELILVATVDYVYYKSYFPGNTTGIVTHYDVPDLLIRELRLQDTFMPITNPNILIGGLIVYE